MTDVKILYEFIVEHAVSQAETNRLIEALKRLSVKNSPGYLANLKGAPQA